MKTIGATLEERGGFGPGFDLLRISLALGVMAFHTAAAVNADTAWEKPPFWVATTAAMPMFFALSGFLIAASAMRLSLGQFLLNRGLRIIPALAVEITLSALILGPLFTTLPLKAYFSNPEFFHYFTNIVGLINYHLPGVFYEHGQPGVVNAALWTIPYEVACYMIISIIIILAIFKRPYLLVIGFLLFTVLPGALRWVGLDEAVRHIPVMQWLLFGHGTLLFPSFLAGCWFYAKRDSVPLNGKLALACLVILLVASPLPSGLIVQTLNLNWLLCLCFAYLTVYIGLADIPKLPVISTGDYSYGIYLYHCPLVNAVYYFTTWNHNPVLLFFMSLPVVCAFAAFSWFTIEKPILKLRKKFSFVGKRLH